MEEEVRVADYGLVDTEKLLRGRSTGESLGYGRGGYVWAPDLSGNIVTAVLAAADDGRRITLGCGGILKLGSSWRTIFDCSFVFPFRVRVEIERAWWRLHDCRKA